MLTFVYDFLHLRNIVIPKNNENSQFKMNNNDLLVVVIPVVIAGRENAQLKCIFMFGHVYVWSHHSVTLKEMNE